MARADQPTTTECYATHPGIRRTDKLRKSHLFRGHPGPLPFPVLHGPTIKSVACSGVFLLFANEFAQWLCTPGLYRYCSTIQVVSTCCVVMNMLYRSGAVLDVGDVNMLETHIANIGKRWQLVACACQHGHRVVWHVTWDTRNCCHMHDQVGIVSPCFTQNYFEE